MLVQKPSVIVASLIGKLQKLPNSTLVERAIKKIILIRMGSYTLKDYWLPYLWLKQRKQFGDRLLGLCKNSLSYTLIVVVHSHKKSKL